MDSCDRAREVSEAVDAEEGVNVDVDGWGQKVARDFEVRRRDKGTEAAGKITGWLGKCGRLR